MASEETRSNNSDIDRPTTDEYFWQIVEIVKTRSTCIRRQVGAIIVRDKRILSTGYNGAPRQMTHCSKKGCIRNIQGIPSGQRHEYCRGVHAEQNAILQAAIFGFSVSNATIYSTVYPCVTCAKMLINVGITEVIYGEDYNDPLAREMFEEAGVKVRRIDEPVENDNQ